MAREIPIKILRGTKAQFTNYGSYPLSVGELGFATDTQELFIGTGTANKLMVGDSAHDAIDTLVHALAEPLYVEYEYNVNKTVNAVRYYTSAAKTTLIREYIYTYSGLFVSTETLKQYNAAGVLLATLTKTLSYTGAFVTSETWAVA